MVPLEWQLSCHLDQQVCAFLCYLDKQLCYMDQQLCSVVLFRSRPLVLLCHIDQELCFVALFRSKLLCCFVPHWSTTHLPHVDRSTLVLYQNLIFCCATAQHWHIDQELCFTELLRSKPLCSFVPYRSTTQHVSYINISILLFSVSKPVSSVVLEQLSTDQH